MEKSKKSFITTGAMAFMTAAAIISLRGLPLMAAEEMTMFFYIAFATIFFLLLLLVFVLARQYYFHKRIKEMIVVTRSILDGEKRQIFSTKEDELGTLSYEINQLASMYDKSQIKYENELFVKKQLISNLSHDVRTPLVSVIGYLEAIVENRIDGEQKDDYIDTAYQKAILLQSLQVLY